MKAKLISLAVAAGVLALLPLLSARGATPATAATVRSVGGVLTSPRALSFGTQQVGTVSPSQTITVVVFPNLSSPGGLPTISVQPMTATSEFVWTACQPITFNPFAYPSGSRVCATSVTFSPAAVGPRSATLSFCAPYYSYGRLLRQMCTVVPVSGTGVAAPGATATPGISAGASISITTPVGTLTVTPASLAFGSQQVGTSGAPQYVTVSALTHGTGLNVAASVTSSGSPAAFAAQLSGPRCGDYPATHLMSFSCTMAVTFAPTAAGAQTATLQVCAILFLPTPARSAPTCASLPLSGTGTTANGNRSLRRASACARPLFGVEVLGGAPHNRATVTVALHAAARTPVVLTLLLTRPSARGTLYRGTARVMTDARGGATARVLVPAGAQGRARDLLTVTARDACGAMTAQIPVVI